jgi:hypothetical protein
MACLVRSGGSSKGSHGLSKHLGDRRPQASALRCWGGAGAGRPGQQVYPQSTDNVVIDPPLQGADQRRGTHPLGGTRSSARRSPRAWHAGGQAGSAVGRGRRRAPKTRGMGFGWRSSVPGPAQPHAEVVRPCAAEHDGHLCRRGGRGRCKTSCGSRGWGYPRP